MAETMIGKWKMESSENFDEYMKALDVNMVLRKMASTASPTLEISEDGGTYQMKTITTFKNTTVTFRLGEPFDEETADGRKVKSTITWEDGNTLVHSQKEDSDVCLSVPVSVCDRQSTITWEEGNTLVHAQKGDSEKGQKDTVLRRTFDGDTMTLTCTVDDITATRVYKRET